jgi:hypothetical protein
MRDQYALGTAGGSMMALGVQDIHATHDAVAKAIRGAGYEPRTISEADRRYTHSAVISPKLKYAHVKDAFTMLGFDQVETLDYSDAEGADHICNLNEPLPSHLADRYDVVLDVGVLEHICDNRQAIENTIRMLKVGGRVALCGLPLFGWHNMCYFNIQPPYLTEMYAANGFDEITTYLNFYPTYREWDDRPLLYRELCYGDETRFTRKHFRTNLCFFARKTKHVEPFVKPLQGFYENYHAASREAQEQPAARAETPALVNASTGRFSWLKRCMRQYVPYRFNAVIWSALEARRLRQIERKHERREFYV